MTNAACPGGRRLLRAGGADQAGEDAPIYARALQDATRVAMSAATLLECSIVVGASRHGDLDQALRDAAIEIGPFDAEQAVVACRAHVEHGRGSGSPARLNFGDCISFALAATRSVPLLFKGEDFTHTGVESALS